MIFLALGSSIGKAEILFKKAEAQLEKQGIAVVRKSKIMKNPPYGGVAQNTFSNAVWEILFPETKWEKINWILLPLWRRQRLKAYKLLKKIKKIEQNLGRTKAAKWDDRVLDLDILMFKELQMSRKKLTIPHSEIPKRNFVLLPWKEIVDDNFQIPRFGMLTNLIKNLPQ